MSKHVRRCLNVILLGGILLTWMSVPQQQIDVFASVLISAIGITFCFATPKKPSTWVSVVMFLFAGGRVLEAHSSWEIYPIGGALIFLAMGLRLLIPDEEKTLSIREV